MGRATTKSECNWLEDNAVEYNTFSWESKSIGNDDNSEWKEWEPAKLSTCKRILITSRLQPKETIVSNQSSILTT
jgi:hypothetical protein